MTVGELRKMLDGVPDDAVVLVEADELLRRANSASMKDGRLLWDFYTETIVPPLSADDRLLVIS